MALNTNAKNSMVSSIHVYTTGGNNDHIKKITENDSILFTETPSSKLPLLDFAFIMSNTTVIVDERTNALGLKVFGDGDISSAATRKIYAALQTVIQQQDIDKFKYDHNWIRAIASWMSDPHCSFKAGLQMFLRMLADFDGFIEQDRQKMKTIETVSFTDQAAANIVAEQWETVKRERITRAQERYMSWLAHLFQQQQQPDFTPIRLLEGGSVVPETQRLKEDLAASVAAKLALESDVHGLKEKLTESAAALLASQAELTTMKEQLAAAQASLATAQTELTNKTAQLATAHESILTEQREAARLQAKLKKSEKEVRKLKSELQKAEEELKNATQEFDFESEAQSGESSSIPSKRSRK
ncbi:hypothetical protein HDV00_009890 [Rhizophlyctis rosea]|nr:hypothetical protein HDV00_009890 [Rhizophlyctis rosea]